MYYYKLKETKAKEYIILSKKEHEYEKMVKEWLLKHFELPEDGTFFAFTDIPEFTEDIIKANEAKLEELLNKTNNRLSKNNVESKKLIEDWKEYKQEKGFEVKESYTNVDTIMFLRSIFRKGSVSTIMDIGSSEVFAETSCPTKSSSVEEITLKEFNLKEIEISEKEEYKEE